MALIGAVLALAVPEIAVAQLGGVGDVIGRVEREVKKPKAPASKPPTPANSQKKRAWQSQW